MFGHIFFNVGFCCLDTKADRGNKDHLFRVQGTYLIVLNRFLHSNYTFFIR